MDKLHTFQFAFCKAHSNSEYILRAGGSGPEEKASLKKDWCYRSKMSDIARAQAGQFVLTQ